MEYLLTLILFPIIWPFIAKFVVFKEQRTQFQTVTWPELAISVLLVCGISAGVYYSGIAYQTVDYEVLNGAVTSKARERVSCSHSYTCNCRTDSKGRTSCSTCYEHSHDYDWNVETTIGQFTIDRVNRRGDLEPPRWTAVQINEPVSRSSMYTNYIKGAPDSLFNKIEYSKNKWVNLIPEYPIDEYDYWHIDRVLGQVDNLPAWNEYLHQKLKTLGPKKQVNVIIVVTPADKTYADAIKYKWLGGKKNDVIVVIGSKDKTNVDWVEVVSWSKKNIFHVELRDAIVEQKTLTPVETIDTIAKHVEKNFHRMEMTEYEYLKNDIEPPVWVIVLAACLAVFGSLGITWFFHKHNF